MSEHHPAQLDFESLWADPPTPATSPIEGRMAFAQRLQDVGMVYSAVAFVDSSGLIDNPLGLEHPSRMLKFPLHAVGQRVYIVHPGLGNQGFVDEVERRLGERPVYDDCIAEVRSRFERHHALDLCRRDRYHLLLESLHLTTKLAVAETVGAELRAACEPSGAITAPIAREILTTIGAPQMSWGTTDVLLAATRVDWRPPDDLPPRVRAFATLENAWNCIDAYERGLVRRDRDGRAVPVSVKAAA